MKIDELAPSWRDIADKLPDVDSCEGYRGALYDCAAKLEETLAAMPDRDGDAVNVPARKDPDDGGNREYALGWNDCRLAALLLSTPPAPVRDGEEGWLAMTCEASRMQHRHLDNHHGDVYHAMQALVVRFGHKGSGWTGPAIDASPSPDAAVAMGGVTDEAFDAAKSAFLKEYTRQVQTCEVMSHDRQLRAALEAFAKGAE